MGRNYRQKLGDKKPGGICHRKDFGWSDPKKLFPKFLNYLLKGFYSTKFLCFLSTRRNWKDKQFLRFITGNFSPVTKGYFGFSKLSKRGNIVFKGLCLTSAVDP